MWQTLAHHRSFRRLWIAATVDAFGSWLLLIAVPVHVYALTGSPASTSLAVVIEALPAVLIGPWAGVVADRFSRRAVLVTANIASAAGVALMLAPNLPFIYLGLLVENLAVTFVRPAFQAAVPTVVPDEKTLASANALLALSNSTWRICGPLLGTYLTAIGWFPAVVLVDLASYLLAALAIPRLARTKITGHRLREGLRHIASTPTLRGMLASNWLYWAANAGLTALLVPFATERLHRPGSAVGALITGLGVGYLCGAALSRTLIQKLNARTIIAGAYTAVGLCFLVMFTATSLPVAVVAATAAGVPGSAAIVATAHHIQVSTPDGMRGRVSAAFHASDSVAVLIGALLTPALTALAGLGRGLLILSVTVLIAAATAAITVPSGPPQAAQRLPGSARPSPRDGAWSPRSTEDIHDGKTVPGRQRTHPPPRSR